MTKEKFIEVHSVCGRIYHVSFDAIRLDLEKDRAWHHKISRAKAKAWANTLDESDLLTWFKEQWSWDEVAKFGKLVRMASVRDVEYALNFIQQTSYPGVKTKIRRGTLGQWRKG